MNDDKMRYNRRTKSYITNYLDYSSIQNYLISAISNLAQNINLLDTKVSILMGTSGLILGLIVTCRSNVYYAYLIFKTNTVTNFVFFFLVACYLFSLFETFYFGLKSLISRIGKSKHDSLWFFSTENKKTSEDQYYKKVYDLSDKEMIKSLSSEVYKLNSINCIKIKNSKFSIVFFSISCFMVLLIFIVVGIVYL